MRRRRSGSPRKHYFARSLFAAGVGTVADFETTLYFQAALALRRVVRMII